MTIQVTIKNDDTRETAVIGVTLVSVDGAPVTGASVTSIKGGESATVHVHSGCALRIAEISQ